MDFIFKNLYLAWRLFLTLGTLSNDDGDADDDGKKRNSKYNNFTLECIQLYTCTKFSLKLQRERPFLEFSWLRERNRKNFPNICLAS